MRKDSHVQTAAGRGAFFWLMKAVLLEGGFGLGAGYFCVEY